MANHYTINQTARARKSRSKTFLLCHVITGCSRFIVSSSSSSAHLQTISPSGVLKNHELLHRITGEGLSVEYCFSRQPFSPDANMVAVQMQFTNSATADAKNLHMEDVKLQSGMRVKEFPEIGE